MFGIFFVVMFKNVDEAIVSFEREGSNRQPLLFQDVYKYDVYALLLPPLVKSELHLLSTLLLRGSCI